MASNDTLLAARGTTDGANCLLTADPALAELQVRCGGRVPGVLAIPELLDLVQQARAMGLGLAREFAAFDGQERVIGFARIQPLSSKQSASDASEGCELVIENLQREPFELDEDEQSALSDRVDRAAAEFAARLDTQQRLQAFSTDAPDLEGLALAIRAEPSRVWTDYVTLQGVAHQQPLHWRLLDAVACEIEGSPRSWRARLIPVPASGPPRGYELLLVADQPREKPILDDGNSDRQSLIGEALTPALREPITRIIGNAETIRGKLAGPVRQEYSDYAGDIAAAGQHLMSLLDDLADIEAVESEDFATASDAIELGDVARRACAMLSERAREKQIVLEVPGSDKELLALGEFRRILQILINLVGNAIAYSPEGSRVELSLARDKQGRVCVLVSDDGPGLASGKQDRIFDKFERLGRKDDSGSGLGLYISRRLALAMGGDLSLESSEGEGAQFTLALPEARSD